MIILRDPGQTNAVMTLDALMIHRLAERIGDLVLGALALLGLHIDQGGIEVHRRIPLSLTFDHRCVTGGEACRFLAALKARPEVQEAHRLAGDIDYILKVRVANERDYDAF